MKYILYIAGVLIFVMIASVAGYFLIPFLSVTLDIDMYLWYPAVGAFVLLAIMWAVTILKKKSKAGVLIFTPILLAIAIPFLINAIKFGEKISVRCGVIQKVSTLDENYNRGITKYYNIFGQKFYTHSYDKNDEFYYHEYPIVTDDGTKGIVIGHQREIETDEIHSVPVINSDGEYVFNRYGDYKFENCKKSVVKYEVTVFDVYGNKLDYIKLSQPIFTAKKSGRQYTLNSEDIYVRYKFVPFSTILSEKYGYTYIPKF